MVGSSKQRTLEIVMKSLLVAIATFAALGYAPAYADNPGYPEPSEAQMHEALMRAMEGRGGNRRGANTISSDNMIAGMAINIESFDKAGCRLASYGAGYFCTFVATTSLQAYSNEGTRAGDQHAQAVNTLMTALMGGRSSTSTTTRRFVRANGTWYASES